MIQPNGNFQQSGIEGLHISTCSELVHFPLDRPPLTAVTLLSAVQDVRAVVAFSEIGDRLKPILSVNLFQKRRAETERMDEETVPMN